MEKVLLEEKTRDFGTALVALKNGYKLAREGWNGKSMWIEMSEFGDMYKDRPLGKFLMMATAQGNFIPWLASQTDILAEDWTVVS